MLCLSTNSKRDQTENVLSKQLLHSWERFRCPLRLPSFSLIILNLAMLIHRIKNLKVHLLQCLQTLWCKLLLLQYTFWKDPLRNLLKHGFTFEWINTMKENTLLLNILDIIQNTRDITVIAHVPTAQLQKKKKISWSFLLSSFHFCGGRYNPAYDGYYFYLFLDVLLT